MAGDGLWIGRLVELEILGIVGLGGGLWIVLVCHLEIPFVPILDDCFFTPKG